MISSSTSTPLYLGTAYYPEHWPEERWPEDIRLMREAGLNVVRMSEFAWSTLEPEAGRFDLDWLERAVEMLAAAGIATVLGTPTAAPPAWLVQQYPDLLAVEESGRPVQFGNRCHYCVNSPELHQAAGRIVGAMAERFGKNPHVIGWQLDNEYNRACYCPRCQELFRGFLQERFGSLDALNRHWSTRYWSQSYSDWAQLPLPIGPHNPGLMLEFKHFVTAGYRRFQKRQLDALRPHLRPGAWVTHNFMGWFDGFDHYEMAADLDMASWDWYIHSGHHDYLDSGAIHDLTRGFKRRNYWLMETQPGYVNWLPVNSPLDRGEARAMAWHAIAHGADAVLYWQWRSALGGQEQYHGTLVDPSGRPRPFYDEVKRLGQDLAAASSLLAGSTPTSPVALLNCYDSRWSIQWQRHHQEFDYVAHLVHYYRPLARRNIAADVISAEAPLPGYRLVIAPALLLLDEGRVRQLADLVAQGGHLVLTVRCGMKDEYNALLPMRQPGPLADLAGAEVEEYYALPEPAPVVGAWLNGCSKLWAERLRVLDEPATEVLARYGASNGWLDGHPAITVHPYGQGRVYLVGAYLDEEAQQTLLDAIVAGAGLVPPWETPPGVEARRRVHADGREVWLLINHGREEQRLTLPWPAYEHLGGRPLRDELQLEPYGVAVLTRSTL